MSLRTGAKPFTSSREVRRLFGLIYPIARSIHYVATMAGSCALHGKGNDLDIIIVPMWNAPTDPYPVMIPLECRRQMIKEICVAVDGIMPHEVEGTTQQVDYFSGIIANQIWLPGKQVIDIKTFPPDYPRDDIRERLGLKHASRKDVHSQYFQFPQYDPKKTNEEE